MAVSALRTSPPKDDKLVIRLSASEKRALAEVASKRHTNMSQFVRQLALDAALAGQQQRVA